MSAKSEIRAALARRQLRWTGRLRQMLGRGNADVHAYAAMCADNGAASPTYQAGKFWNEINRDFRHLIYAGALENLRNQYFNRRFAGPDPCSWQVYEAFLRLYYQRLMSGPAAAFLATAEEPTCGGTGDQLLVEGRRMSLDFLQSIDEAFQIQEAWSLAGRTGHPRTIVELGAGYGRLAYVARKVFPECSYVVLDLPEALACSSSWLTRALPDEVVPYAESRGQGTLDRRALESRPVWTLGAHQIEGLAADSADVFVNIYSFAEMPPRSIENYFGHVDRLTVGVFYTKQRKLERNPADAAEVAMETYLTRPGWRTLFFRTATLYEAAFEAACAVRTT